LDVDDEIITMEELKEAPKTKHGMLPGQDNLNSELYKYTEATFLERLLFFITFI
jgi:hypothetical protein